MRLIDNINSLLGEDLKGALKPGSKLKIAASCFSIYAYVALKKELENIGSLEFIFTSPTFVPNEASDTMKKEQREFHIPKTERERSLTGSEFEIQLKNKLTQKAISRECADWIRRKANGDLAHVPNGMHAVVPAQPDLGLLPGVIFTLRSRKPGAPHQQQNRLYPFSLIYIGNDGRIISDHTEAKRLLDLARSACKAHGQPLRAAYEPFNRATDDGRNMQAYSTLLDQAIRSMIDRKEEKDIDSLFSGGKTTALVNSIAGLDDFELITFIVIQDAS